MSYDARERSRYHGKPVNLLRFRYANFVNSVYGYTDAEQAIIHDGVEYNPIPVERDAIQSSGNLNRKTMSIVVPSDSDIANLYRGYPPSRPVSVTILQGHLTDDDVPKEFLVAWIGRVLNGKHSQHRCTLSCESLVISMTRIGLRRRYQYMCPHVLYGPQCRASKPAATVTVLPSAKSGNILTLPSSWDEADRIPKYAGGIVEWNTADTREIRTILSINGSTQLRLTGPCDSIPDGGTVQVSLGCNHQLDDCLTLHNNRPNFGGCPWIPIKNPSGTISNIYY